MQTEDFEKQVKQKMEALSFSPSDPVWQHIEKEIRNKKERKRVLFWLLSFLLAGIAIGGVFYYSDHHDLTVEATEKSKNNIEGINKNDLTKVENKKENSGSGKDANTEEVKLLSTENKISITEGQQAVEASILNDKNHSFIISSSTKKIKTTKGFKKVKVENGRSNDIILTESISSINRGDQAVDFNNSVTKDLEKVVEDTAIVQPLPMKDSTLSDTVSIVKVNKKKWTFSGGFTVGRSGISTSAFNFSTPASAQSLYDAAPLQSSGGSFARPASALKNGFSYSVHFSARRHLFKHVGITTGLRYNYFSTSIQTGQKLLNDTTIIRNANALQLSAYYRSSNADHQYKNQYHFIELPVGLSFNLLKKNKLNIEPGLSVGYLLNTNALYYNQQAQIYYTDASVYNKTTLSLYTHVTYKVVQFKKASIAVGPSAQFTLSNFVNNKSKGRQHLYQAGLSTKVYFK